MNLLNLPQTVVFHYSKPSDWFFSINGKIKRKSKINITIKKIINTFTKNIGKSGIAAYFIHRRENSIEYQYFNVDELGKFFFSC